VSATTTTASKSIDRLLEIIGAFREIDHRHRGITTEAIAAFLLVARNPGIGLSKIAETLGVAESTATRNVFLLSRFREPGLHGLDLVVSDINPENRREKVVHLTPKGEILARKLIDKL
jgi:DNA-binding MarR family transcriptional regulator